MPFRFCNTLACLGSYLRGTGNIYGYVYRVSGCSISAPATGLSRFLSLVFPLLKKIYPYKFVVKLQYISETNKNILFFPYKYFCYICS